MKKNSSSFDSESEWTGLLAGMLSSRPDVSTGIGDDAAVVRLPGSDRDIVLTTDAVIESVHFDKGTDPGRIGHKMVGRLLSDIAAMGAEPGHILLNLVIGPSRTGEDCRKIYEGAEALAKSFGVSIIGGDTARGEALALHGFASGFLPAGTAVLRSGAVEGDRIYVTGELGGSREDRHLDFTPRVKEGVWLREGQWATAMMDLSDGLACDLRRLCARSGVGAVIESESLPLSPAAKKKAKALESGLCDGEDYELLFTVAAAKADVFEKSWAAHTATKCTCIGEMKGASNAVLVNTKAGVSVPMPDNGYDHLSKQ